LVNLKVIKYIVTTYTKLWHQIFLYFGIIVQQESLHKILEDKQVQVATFQCNTRSFQPQQSHTGVASFMDKLRRYESAYKYWRLGRVESCSGKGPLIRVLSTLLQYLIKSESQTKVPSSGSSLAKIVEQRAIKYRIQYIHCR
jgi:hypothetical protein